LRGHDHQESRRQVVHRRLPAAWHEHRFEPIRLGFGLFTGEGDGGGIGDYREEAGDDGDATGGGFMSY